MTNPAHDLPEQIHTYLKRQKNANQDIIKVYEVLKTGRLRTASDIAALCGFVAPGSQTHVYRASAMLAALSDMQLAVCEHRRFWRLA